ncbi:hypothetical protein BS47DRAFT_1066598 [Hydnum rufescens UP504]|uniref:Uncharacterized protein n=1 Tax=Hydnum rufescens UP504 TaxID=1448309 RepID=A0A9P6DV73_9AGAM|nr:hypothetical protein BS47DRAFT_1066598 [Hydnum rufescens UP504]
MRDRRCRSSDTGARKLYTNESKDKAIVEAITPQVSWALSRIVPSTCPIHSTLHNSAPSSAPLHSSRLKHPSHTGTPPLNPLHIFMAPLLSTGSSPRPDRGQSRSLSAVVRRTSRLWIGTSSRPANYSSGWGYTWKVHVLEF